MLKLITQKVNDNYWCLYWTYPLEICCVGGESNQTHKIITSIKIGVGGFRDTLNDKCLRCFKCFVDEKNMLTWKIQEHKEHLRLMLQGKWFMDWWLMKQKLNCWGRTFRTYVAKKGHTIATSKHDPSSEVLVGCRSWFGLAVLLQCLGTSKPRGGN